MFPHLAHTQIRESKALALMDQNRAGFIKEKNLKSTCTSLSGRGQEAQWVPWLFLC